jgi:hypothetical protein
MLSACTEVSSTVIHELCMTHWPDLTERLQSIPPWEWPDKLTPWLLELGGPLGDGEQKRSPDVARLVGALALVNALGRLHRTRTGSVHDAFRAVRDLLLKDIRQCLSPQEVFALLDAIDFEARSLEHAFFVSAA